MAQDGPALRAVTMTAAGHAAPIARAQAIVPAPYFSVIVMTWQRRTFLRAAITSVLRQDAPREDFEIIVVKGFQEPELDGFLRENGICSCLSKGPGQGAALAQAVDRARGEVIAFLDDDDEFEATKLSTLRREFDRDAALAVYRHCNRSIDVAGQPLPAWPCCDWPALPQPRAITLSTPEAKRRAKTLPMHNLSTIAVRRSAIQPFVPAWTGVEAAADALVLLSGFAADGSARADPRVLSRRRIHPSSSLENYSSEGAGLPSSLDRLERLVRSHARIRQMVRGTPAQRAAAWVDLILRFDAAMTSTRFPDPSVRDLASMVRGIGRERQPFRIWVLAFAVVRRFAPHGAIRAWWRFCRLRDRQRLPGVSYPALFPRRPVTEPSV